MFDLDFCISPDIAEICGIHAGDGYLRNDGKRRELDISGNIDEKEYYDSNVIPLFNKVFNLDIEGKHFPSRNTYGFVIRDRNVVEFMHFLGFPYGAKSSIVRIPSFIFESKALMLRFLRGYFDTDGCVCCIRRTKGKYVQFKKKFHYYPLISFTTVSPDLFERLNKIWDILGFKAQNYVHNSKKKKEKPNYCHVINGACQVIKFFELVNPLNTSKTSRYKIWKKFGFCPAKTTFKQRCKILKGQHDILSFYPKRARSIMDMPNAP